MTISPSSRSPYMESTGAYRVSPVTRGLANLTYRFNKLGEKLTTGPKYEKAGPIAYRLRKFTAMLLDWDIRHYYTFFGGRLAIPKNPIGMLLFLLFPVVIGSRVARAKERDAVANEAAQEKARLAGMQFGKQQAPVQVGSEVGDVLRRDFMTLIPFVFMLPAMANVVNWARQKKAGINQVEKKEARDIVPVAYNYDQLGNAFDLNNPRKLTRLVAEGNGKGLKLAADRTYSMYENVLTHLPDGNVVLDHYKKYVDTVGQMAAEGHALGASLETPKDNSRLSQLSEAAFEQMQKAQTAFDEVKHALSKTDTPLGRATNARFTKNIKYLPPFSESLIQYAKMKRLPSDLLSIALTVVAMGYFPVAFNDYLSRRRLAKLRQERQMAETNAKASPVQSQISISTISQIPSQSAYNPFQVQQNSFDLAAFQ